jgi:arginine exporter protein ArgO
MLPSTGFAVAIAGLRFGLSLISAIGHQSAYVLRQGAIRDLFTVAGAAFLFASAALAVRRARLAGALASSPDAAATRT